MVLYTPNRALPYVEGTDTPITYPTTSEDLANKLDSVPIVVTAMLPSNYTLTGTLTTIMSCTSPAVPYRRIMISGIHLRMDNASATAEQLYTFSGMNCWVGKGSVYGAGTHSQSFVAYPQIVNANTVPTVTCQASGIGIISGGAIGSTSVWMLLLPA